MFQLHGGSFYTATTMHLIKSGLVASDTAGVASWELLTVSRAGVTTGDGVQEEW